MEMTVVTVGAICLLAAIAGGGFEALGIKVPLVPSFKRQVMLGSLGLVLVLTPTAQKLIPSPALPVTTAPDFADCGKVVSTSSTEKAELVFKNYSQKTIDIYWINQQGNPQFHARLAPQGTYPVETYTGHSWCFIDKSSSKAIQTVMVLPGATEIPIH